VVWVNIHSVALFGVAVIAAYSAGACWESLRARRTASPVVAAVTVTGVAGLAMLVNPWGIGLLTHSLDVARLSGPTMSEWYPLWRAGPIALVPVVVAALASVLVVRTGGWRRPSLALPLAFAGLASVQAIRNAPFFALVAAVCGAAMVSAPSEVMRARLAERRALATFGVVVALVVALVVAVPRVAATGDPGGEVPVASTAALPAGCRLLNDYRLGGWVIFARPDVPVSADGRNDLYGLEGYEQNAWFEAAAGPSAASLATTLTEEGVDCVLARTDSPLPGALEADGWTVVGRDQAGIALVPPPSGP